MPVVSVADYLARGQRASSCLPVPGGGAMFLSDTLCHQTGIAPVFFHHEQAAAMAAEAYARIADVPPVRNVTTSPGSINAFNGAFGAWTDSMPMTEISGQVKRATSLATKPVPGLREQGDQEDEPVRMARTISKCAAVIERADDIAWHADQALHLSTSGRPGSVWLDVPIAVRAR